MAREPCQLCWRGFSLPKRGNTAGEYEDALAANPRAGRFAIADGASESSFAGEWAKLIVDAFVKDSPSPTSPWLQWARRRWQRLFENRPMAWHTEAKFEQGAFATWLGVSVAQPNDSSTGAWEAYAIGDCCLFQIRNNRLLRAFPVRRSSDFGRDPELLGSRPGENPSAKPKRQRLKADWQSGDALFLMSDALAQWFLRNWEGREHPWQLLEEVKDASAFAELIDKLRDEKALRNDDVTFLVIHWPSENSR